MEDLHAKHGIPRELYGVKIKVVELRKDQGVVCGRLLRKGSANCKHPGCFRVRPVSSLYCRPHDPERFVTTPPGDTCKLRYTWRGAPGKHPSKGDVLETSTGRRYLILKISGKQEGGRMLGPMHLEVLVMYPDDEVPEGARVYDFSWDKREKK